MNFSLYQVCWTFFKVLTSACKQRPNLFLDHPNSPNLEMAISQQPLIRLRQAKEKDLSCTMRLGGRLGQVWVSLDDPGWLKPDSIAWQDGPKHKIDRGGHLWSQCTRKWKHSSDSSIASYSMNLVPCAWLGNWVKFGSVWMLLADPTAVARQVGTPIGSSRPDIRTACAAPSPLP